MIPIASLSLLFCLVPQNESLQSVELVTTSDVASSVAGEISVRTAPGRRDSSVSSPAMAPVLMNGWPRQFTIIGNFAPSRGLAFEDLDGDGRMEIVRSLPGVSTSTGSVHVWRYDGTAFPGWPRTTAGMAQYVPTVADLDGDGSKEILVTARGLTSGGGLYVYRSNGTDFPGWPKTGIYFANSATAADLDGDGKLEIIALERRYPVGYVHVFRLDGTAFPGSWPFALDHVPTGTPAVADVDADGKPEIVTMSYKSLYVIGADGKGEPGWPYDVSAKHQANFSYQSVALGDLTGDGKLEIATCCHKAGGCFVFRHDGTLLPGWPKPLGGWSYSPPTLVDLDGDGKLDVLAGRAGGLSAAPVIYAWKASGTLLSGFPIYRTGSAEGPLTVADIDDDGTLEFFADSSVRQSNQGYLWCYDSKGNLEPGFPIRTTGFTYMNGATIGDVDGDGVLEMGIISSLQGSIEILLYKLTGPTKPGRIEWKTYHESNARRGLVDESDRFAVTGDVSVGGQLRFELQGPPRSAGVVLGGLKVAVLPVPGLGVLRLDPSQPIFPLWAAALLTGRQTVVVPLPNTTAIQGIFLPMQGVNLFNNQATLNELNWIRVR